MAIISSKIFSATFPSQISIVHMLDYYKVHYILLLYILLFFSFCVSFLGRFFLLVFFFPALNSLTFYSAVIIMLIVANFISILFSDIAFLIIL